MSVRAWCQDHWIPYVHGCVWDRECRTEFYLWRIALMWGTHMWWIDLPGYYKDFERDPERENHLIAVYSWHRPRFGHYHRT